MPAVRAAIAVTVSIAIASLLSSCIMMPSIVSEVSQNGPVNDRPVVEGPEGWTDFPSCEAGPRDDYVWVDGFPSTELASTGIDPDCGDTWIEPDGDNFMNVTDYSLSAAQLDALEAALVASGWEKKWDDFVPATGPDRVLQSVGARDFYRDGDTRLFAVEIYYNGSNSYTAYLDYHSPETRALG